MGYERARRGAVTAPIPANDSYMAEVDGKVYVVLQNIDGIRAVYRLCNDGFLKELPR